MKTIAAIAIGSAVGARTPLRRLMEQSEEEKEDMGPLKYADYGQKYPQVSETVQNEPLRLQAGLANQDYYYPPTGATFPAYNLPFVMPDLSDHNNMCAIILRENPDLWGKYLGVTTSKGNTFATCIKTGMDNKRHPNIVPVGAVFADEECYPKFKDFFDKVILMRHGYAADGKHPTGIDLSTMSQIQLDPDYCKSPRIRTGRSIKGINLPPGNDYEGRKKVESIVTSALATLDGDYEGTYYPLPGSYSYDAMPGGMSEEQASTLLSKGNLFQKPDSTLLLSIGCGKNWPHARGIWENKDNNCYVWLNEEDHMRIISMQKGTTIQKVAHRFVDLISKVEEAMKKEGNEYLKDDHLGYVLTCPSNLGGGVRCGARVRVPEVSKLYGDDFKPMAKRLGLQVRGIGGVDSTKGANDGIFDISNKDRLGVEMVNLFNTFIYGTDKLIAAQKLLEKDGDNADEAKKIIDDYAAEYKTMKAQWAEEAASAAGEE